MLGIIKNAFNTVSMHNGWAMAALGMSIVFSGLVILSIIISQLHKFLLFIEKKDDETVPEVGEDSTQAIPDIFPEDVNEVAALYKPLFEKLGSSFKLTELYTLSGKSNFPHPHLTITRFRNVGILIPVGDGIFSWHMGV